jgi:hypothetical protein
MNLKLGGLAIVILGLALFFLFAPRDLAVENEISPSKILEYSNSGTKISNSVLLGVKAFENSLITIEDSRIFRVVTYGDSKIILKNTTVSYVNDRDLRLESLNDEIFKGISRDREKILAVYSWVNGSIKNNVSGLEKLGSWDQEYKATVVLREMNGDCGSHSALFTALAHQAGFPSRIIELWYFYPDGAFSKMGHVVSEVFFDGRWAMFDTDPVTNNAHIYLDGQDNILNVKELMENPDLVDSEENVWAVKNGLPWSGMFQVFNILYLTLSIDERQTPLPSDPQIFTEVFGHEFFSKINSESLIFINKRGDFFETFYESDWRYLKGKHFSHKVVTKDYLLTSSRESLSD